MGTTREETARATARNDAREHLARLDENQLESRWNGGPTTRSILRAIAAQPDRVRSPLGRLLDEPTHPALSTVYVRPTRPVRISVGPSQFQLPPADVGDDLYQHLDWCECAELLRIARDDFGLDPERGPDKILPRTPGPPDPLASSRGEWFMLWWD
ncbi:hypothetical protein CLV34_2123 [Luteimicrobium subarcticum]|uniref:Uncharacterized protein n=1 Tax=Luteimicrobium subarcticum TaxID=620910 RepID=A0A2M8WRK8_9MICO|nr:hypothetical protein CLV34_2123 [Luteimicrobium subarcticum]